MLTIRSYDWIHQKVSQYQKISLLYQRVFFDNLREKWFVPLGIKHNKVP